MYTMSSTKVIPETRRQAGVAAVPMVLVLMVVIALVGGSALNLFSNESKQSQNQLVGFRLESLARTGLESNFSLLRSMGTVTAFQTSETVVVSGAAESKNTNLIICDYFPRTDDAILPTASNGDYGDPNLVDNPTSEQCLKARANNANFIPAQLARYPSTTNSDLYETGDRLNIISNAATSDKSFRSIFPWVRHRSETIMNDQYGSDEEIKGNLNACGIMSQLRSSTTSSLPSMHYRYEQEMDGLGETWIDLGGSRMNLYENGLTLEAWVWMGNEANSKRVWQRIFDIGRSAQDGNIVLAYHNDTGRIDFHIKSVSQSACDDARGDRQSENPHPSCSGELFTIPAADRVSTPENNVTGNSLDESGGNDLWFYIAARVDPASVNQPKVRIYTQCSRSGGGDITQADHPDCFAGTLVRGEGATGLRRRGEWTMPWNANQDHAYYRKAWVGKSHWQDDDFRGKIRDARIWEAALDEDALASAVLTNTTDSQTESSITKVKSQRESLRISPLQKFGDDRLLMFTVKETDANYTNSWRMVSCAWNNKASVRKTRSLRFRVVGDERPEVTEFLPF